MHQNATAHGILRWTALSALFLIPFTPLIVADGFFFPFITGKAFYFRILAEIAFFAWLGLAVLDKAYRPRVSWIGIAALALLAWMFVADAFALNALKAFWSNFERMEGWVFLAHLVGFFFASSAVLRVGRAWRGWFLTALGVSVVISIHAIFQIAGVFAIHQGSTRIDASLGNSAYLAIYLLFSVFVSLWLALTERRAWLKWALILLAGIESVLIFFTETRGTVLGLVGAFVLVSLLTAVYSESRRAKWFAIAAIVVLVAVTGTFIAMRDSSFVQENHALQRVSSISPADGQTRFTIWGMALKGVAERPLTGWGQEGFNYIFNTYFEPSLFGQEPWFDRAHNVFMDWLTAGGIPAFVFYLGLFGSALFLLWKRSELSRYEAIALTGALAGYAVHNLFVFDNLSSYIYFFAILALVDSQVARPVERFERAGELSAEDGITTVLPVTAVVAVAVLWFVNWPGIQVATKLITAITPSGGSIAGNIAAFESLSANPAFAAQEVREQLVTFASSAVQSAQVSAEEKQKIAALAVSEMQKQVAAYPLDVREHLELSYAYRTIGDAAGAAKEIDAALALSPKKQDIWLQGGALAWDLNDVAAAQKYFNTAYGLSPESADLAVYAAAGNLAAGDRAAADKILLETFETTKVDSDVLAVAYYRTKDWKRLVELWQMRIAKPGSNAQSWFSLAAAYYAAGDKANAIQTIRQAVKLYPEAASSGEAAIAQIEGTGQ